jgi:hypothetical protein
LAVFLGLDIILHMLCLDDRFVFDLAVYDPNMATFACHNRLDPVLQSLDIMKEKRKVSDFTDLNHSLNLFAGGPTSP